MCFASSAMTMIKARPICSPNVMRRKKRRMQKFMVHGNQNQTHKMVNLHRMCVPLSRLVANLQSRQCCDRACFGFPQDLVQVTTTSFRPSDGKSCQNGCTKTNIRPILHAERRIVNLGVGLAGFSLAGVQPKGQMNQIDARFNKVAGVLYRTM